ncbi:MAG: hypothetical protein HC836_43780 [Richelia sp. RM2_1_2]|nr:hypothetical protein [Richelia sp. RM2_1_2]
MSKTKISLIAIGFVLYAIAGIYFPMFWQPNPYQFKVDDQVCIGEKFSGMILKTHLELGANMYKIAYTTPNGLKIEDLPEKVIKLGKCEKN